MPVRASIASGNEPAAKIAGLDAALSLFVRHGVEATSIRDIACQSGFTNPAIFKHFETKVSLALCLFERCYAWMSRAITEAENACGDKADALSRIMAIASCALRLMDDDIEAVLMVQDNLRQFWRQTEPAVRGYSLLGRIRMLAKTALEDDRPISKKPPAPSAKLIASAIAGLLGQIAREAYFHELSGSASALTADIHEAVRRLLGVEPSQ